jgi:hypothetical protein
LIEGKTVVTPPPDGDHEYAHGGIPLYLPIGRDKSSVTLSSAPENDDYRQDTPDALRQAPALPLPETFGFDLGPAAFV